MDQKWLNDGANSTTLRSSSAQALCALIDDSAAKLRYRSFRKKSMKRASACVVFFFLWGVLRAQTPLSQDDALKRMYGNYDAGTKTAILACTNAQRVENAKSPGAWWPCYEKESSVSVAILLMAVLPAQSDPSHEAAEAYILTSAVPAHDPSGFSCHSCKPAIGVAHLNLKAQKLEIAEANATVGFYGAWGRGPICDLVGIGPAKYGFLLSEESGGQGYISSSEWLVAPIGTSVAEIWHITDEQDDFGAYDPNGRDGPSIRYRSAAAIRFNRIPDGSGTNEESYFEIEVISRGRDQSGSGAGLRSQNWTDIYRFKDNKYRLVRHQRFTETKAGIGRKPVGDRN